MIYLLTEQNANLVLDSTHPNLVFVTGKQDLVQVHGNGTAPQTIIDFGQTLGVETYESSHVDIVGSSLDKTAQISIFAPKHVPLPAMHSDGAGGSLIGHVDLVDFPPTETAGHVFISHNVSLGSPGG